MKHIICLLFLFNLISTISVYGMESMQDAAASNDLITLDKFLSNGMNVNATEIHSGDTALHLAAKGNKIQAVKLLLENEANVNAKNKTSLTPLHMASVQGHLDTVKLLLDYGADVNIQDHFGLTPLHMASQYGHVDVMEYLLVNGANVHAKTNDQGLTPLHWVAFWGYTEGVKTLLAYGADINAKDSTGDTPLIWANFYDHDQMAHLLARLGGKRRK